MNRDKKLYNLMIKNHPTIVGWFIHKGVVKKNGDGLYIVDDDNEETISVELPNENNYHVCETDDKGVRRIDYVWCGDEVFSRIDLNYEIGDGVSEKLIDAGFPLFEFGVGIHCFTHQIEDIINNFPDLVLDIYFPKNKRIKGKFIENFFKFLQNQVDFVRNNNNSYDRFDIIGGRVRWSKESKLEKLINIDKHGLFAHEMIYRNLEWDFDMVEKYKDKIMWVELINWSNLIWSDEMLKKYEKYIPFCNKDEETYCGRFKKELDYRKFGFLGNSFLESHKDDLDWMRIFKECEFDWSAKEMTYFVEYALGIDLPYSDSFPSTTASSQIEFSLSCLISNRHFKWTPSNLLTYLLLRRENWEALVDDFRPELFKIFLSIPNIKEIAVPYVKDIKNFWEIVSNPHLYPYDELSPEFTIERIQNNIEEWSNVVENKFFSMRRTPDTNYYYYRAINQWDIYKDRNNIPLTYELAKYLSTIEIKIGGEYMESDSGYLERDDRFPVYNGLEAFSSHHIDTTLDMEKILEDEDVANILLDYNHSINLDLLYYTIGRFFKDYPLKEYINVINNLKEWDVVKEFCGDEERYNTFSEKDWDKLMDDIMI